MMESQEWQVALADVFSKFLELTLPVGGIILYAGETAPDGWVFCNGASVSAQTYPALADALHVQETIQIPSLPAPSASVRYIMRVGTPNL